MKYELELEKLLKDDIPKITDDQVDKLIKYESLRPGIINVVIDAHIHEKFKRKFELDTMNKNRRRRVKKGKKRK